MKACRGDRIFYRTLKHTECTNHQPFIKMEKAPEFYGYRCSKCGNWMDELVREYRLKRRSK